MIVRAVVAMLYGTCICLFTRRYIYDHIRDDRDDFKDRDAHFKDRDAHFNKPNPMQPAPHRNMDIDNLNRFFI